MVDTNNSISSGNTERAATPTAKATKIDHIAKQKACIVRCVKCHRIISLNPNKLDVNGYPVLSNLDSTPHLCLKFDVIQESDVLTPDSLTDELFLQMIRAGGYMEQARTLMYKIPVFEPTPVFLVRLADIQDSKIKQELVALNDSALDSVMHTAIGRVFECINERQYNLSVRKLLRWEIGA